MNEYEMDLKMDELEHDLEQLLRDLRKVLRAIHVANCPTCRAQGEAEAEAPTPPVLH